METEALIEALADPRAYPHEAPAPQLIQTHISVVALAGPWVYKIKKPLDLGFLDFRELSVRRSMCAEEVRLNRRLAPHVYQGVVALTRNARGQLRVGGSGEPVEYAVQMRRLPDEATLAARLERDELDAPLLGLVGRRLARFHEAAARGESVQKMASYEQVAFNHRENLEQTEPHIGRCVSAARHEAVRERVELELARRRALIDDRAARRACEGHGDLRLEHVYVFEDQQPPRDLVVLDAIEFNERFRHADPIADLAFPVMELLDVGRRDLADALTDAWARQTQDLEGLALMPLYVSYRALVRAKVDGIMAGEPEVPEDPRAEAAARARRRWRLAERALTRAQQEPALILVAGLPGSGKSTLARHLAGALGARIVATDRVRKELAGLAMDEPAEAAFGEGHLHRGVEPTDLRDVPGVGARRARGRRARDRGREPAPPRPPARLFGARPGARHPGHAPGVPSLGGDHSSAAGGARRRGRRGLGC